MMEKVIVKRATPAFADDRGSISDILDDVAIKHIGLITSKAGAVRAKHYHKKGAQYNYVISGQLELKTRRIKEKETRAATLNPGDLCCIPANVVHSLTATKDSVFFDFKTESRSADGYEKDTFRVEEV